MTSFLARKKSGQRGHYISFDPHWKNLSWEKGAKLKMDSGLAVDEICTM